MDGCEGDAQGLVGRGDGDREREDWGWLPVSFIFILPSKATADLCIVLLIRIGVETSFRLFRVVLEISFSSLSLSTHSYLRVHLFYNYT